MALKLESGCPVLRSCQVTGVLTAWYWIGWTSHEIRSDIDILKRFENEWYDDDGQIPTVKEDADGFGTIWREG